MPSSVWPSPEGPKFSWSSVGTLHMNSFHLVDGILSVFLTEGDAETFSVCGVSTPVQVGVPFSLSMELKDEFGHPARPPPDLKPKLECRYVPHHFPPSLSLFSPSPLSLSLPLSSLPLLSPLLTTLQLRRSTR